VVESSRLSSAHSANKKGPLGPFLIQF
jgi:hypothetical protein